MNFNLTAKQQEEMKKFALQNPEGKCFMPLGVHYDGDVKVFFEASCKVVRKKEASQ